MQGFIKLYRQISENQLWTLEPFTKGQAWIDLLLLTQHTKGLITLRNGELVQLERGECGWSKLKLAKRWQWSRDRVTRFFNYLCAQNMIQQKNFKKTTIITILNYDRYQGDTTNDTTNNTTNDTTNDTLTRMIKNDKNNICPITKIMIPTKEDIETYCKIIAKRIDIEEFINYYTASNWKDKNNLPINWKQKVISWAKRNPIEEPKKYNPYL